MGFGAEATESSSSEQVEDRPIKSGSAEDAAFIMSQAQNVIIVPGLYMAVAQAQHALKNDIST